MPSFTLPLNEGFWHDTGVVVPAGQTLLMVSATGTGGATSGSSGIYASGIYDVPGQGDPPRNPANARQAFYGTGTWAAYALNNPPTPGVDVCPFCLVFAMRPDAGAGQNGPPGFGVNANVYRPNEGPWQFVNTTGGPLRVWAIFNDIETGHADNTGSFTVTLGVPPTAPTLAATPLLTIAPTIRLTGT